MSRIVMVHGAGNDLWGPSSIKAKWLPALADGLAWHGVTLDPSEVTVAFYGDLFREDPQLGYEPPVDTAAALASVSNVVKNMDPTVDLDELTKMLTEHHFDRLLAQANAYLANDAIRHEAQAHVAAAITPETQVVLAHSLGTVVAYETLRSHPEFAVTDFVTIGCPLARPLVHDALDRATDVTLACWPGSIKTWTNVADADDPAAAMSLCGRFDGAVIEFAVDNGHRVHDPEPYLNNRWTGEAIAKGLAAPR